MENQNVRILQITDTHLFADDNRSMFGIRTNDHFYKVVEAVKHDTKIKPDLFLLTGDLSQDESEASYKKIVAAFEFFNIPVYWIPGNHDNIEVMTRIFNQSPVFHHVRQLALEFFNLIFLNTKLSGTDEGYLSETELNDLNHHLKKATAENKSVIIVMHHHPIKTQTPLIDAFILKNADAFWKIVNQHPQTKLIICGHVHGDYCIQSGEIIMESAPATCVQWQKGATQLSIEKKIGYKIYTLSETGYHSETRLWQPLS